MSPRKVATQKPKITEVHTAEIADTQQDAQADTQPFVNVDVQIPDVVDMQPAEMPKKRRKLQTPAAPMELDPQYVANPERMQYALLLALLLRQKGTAKFSAKDMEYVDTDYNILFARTLDGQHLEVTVVSAQSGIIRSPERERQQEVWRLKEEAARTLTYPNIPPAPSTEHPAAALFTLQGMDPNQIYAGFPPQPVRPFDPNQMAQKAQAGLAPASIQPQGQVVPFPVDQQKNPDGSAPYHFPFQTGDRPETAGPVNLDHLHQQLLQRDQEIQQQEAEAIERQERGQ